MSYEKFSSDERLSRQEIQAVFKEGKRLEGRSVTLIYRPSNLDASNGSSGSSKKMAVVVPKRVLKRAHERNRMKRRFRELYRRNKSEFSENYHYVFFMGRPPFQKSFKHLKEDMLSLTRQLPS